MNEHDRAQGPAIASSGRTDSPILPRIPDVDPECSTLDAAWTYQGCGLSVLPIQKGGKVPAKVDGQMRGVTWATNDAKTATAYWAGTDHGIGIAAGASNVVIIDVDYTSNVPDEWWPVLDLVPFQNTDINDARKGHYFFSPHPDYDCDNGIIKPIWGEVKAGNGYVVAAPSTHQRPDGLYRWERTGSLTQLPVAIIQHAAFCYPQATDTAPAPSPATDQTKEVGPGYALAALNKETQRVRSAREGSRNQTLNNAALALGGIVHVGEFDEATAANALITAALDAGLDAGESRSTFRSGWNAGVNSPRNVTLRQVPALKLPDLNDDAQATAIIEEHGHLIRYASGLGWLVWDGQRWVSDSDDGVREYAKVTARQIQPHQDLEKAQANAVWAWRKTCLSAQGITNVLKQAQSDPRVRIDAEVLDGHPLLLNTPAGVVDLTTGAVLEHEPGLLQTRITTASISDAPAPRWHQFLAQTFATNPDLIDYVQALMGLALIGEVREHLLPFLHGPGANGKSVFTEVMQSILGDASMGGYGLAATERLFNAGERHSTELARLRGARLVIASEQTGTRAFDEARVKALTGGDKIVGRFMRKDDFTFTPSHLPMVVGNALPPVKVGGKAFWRRVRVIPFINTVAPQDRDPQLARHIMDDEGPQVLWWCVQGAIDYLRDGLTTPAIVEAASLDYEQSEDPLANWLIDNVTITEQSTDSITSKDLHTAYQEWCAQSGLEAISQRSMILRLKGEWQLKDTKVGKGRLRGLAGIQWATDEATGSAWDSERATDTPQPATQSALDDRWNSCIKCSRPTHKLDHARGDGLCHQCAKGQNRADERGVSGR
jgi:putative DNA primase/helicase